MDWWHAQVDFRVKPSDWWKQPDAATVLLRLLESLRSEFRNAAIEGLIAIEHPHLHNLLHPVQHYEEDFRARTRFYEQGRVAQNWFRFDPAPCIPVFIAQYRMGSRPPLDLYGLMWKHPDNDEDTLLAWRDVRDAEAMKKWWEANRHDVRFYIEDRWW